MLASLTASFGRLSCGVLPSALPKAASSFAGPSATRRPLTSHTSRTMHFAASSRPSLPPTANRTQLGGVRHKGALAPIRSKYRKAHKITIPFNTGGSLKGTTVQHGDYGLRILAPTRLSAKQLEAAEAALKRKLKVVKGAQIYRRVFPDIPVCIKGNETRMGKGKGTFEYWACRAKMGRVIFEIGGVVPIRPEVAKEALRLVAAKLPVPTEFVTKASLPRLGNILVPKPTKGVPTPVKSPEGPVTSPAA